MRARLRAFLLVFLAACSSETTEDAAMVPGKDAAVYPDADLREYYAVIGGGVRSMFTPLTEGATVSIVQGAQGGGRYEGHHIWGSTRVSGFNLDTSVVVTYSVSTTDGEIRADLTLLRSFLPSREVPGAYETWGLAARMDDCCLVAEREIDLKVEVRDGDGRVAGDQIRVRATQCPAEGPSLCP